MTVDTGYNDLTYSLAGLGRPSNPFDQRRKYAYGMLQQGSDSSPVQHPLQAASRLAQALVGGWMAGQANRDEVQARDAKASEADRIAALPDPQSRLAAYTKLDPELGMKYGAQLAVEQAKIQQQQAGLQTGGAQIAQGYGYGAPGGGPQQAGGDAASRIAGIESAGGPNGGYGAVGPPANAQGQRAYGKFQVMDFNVGPWTQEVLGKAMTPQEFLQNPQAQDAVFKAKFGQFAQKHGSQEAAAREWFAGPSGMNNPNATDANGMSVARYGQKFSGGQPPQQVAQAGGPPVVPQGNNPQVAPGMPPAPSPQGIAAPAVSAAPPAAPELQRPMPSQATVDRHLQIYRSGGYGLGPEAQAKARAAIESDAEKEFQLTHERQKMEYQQKLGDYEARRNNDIQQPQQNVQNEAKMREQFDQLQSVKDYRKANTVFRSAVDASRQDTKASDLNMVYAFATLMDPGSVVRDSETGMVQATAGASARIKGLIDGLQGKSTLGTETKQALVREMNSRYQAYKTAHDDLANTFGGIADRSGVNRQNVVVPYPEVQYESPAAKGGTPGAPVYEYRGGKLVPRQ